MVTVALADITLDWKLVMKQVYTPDWLRCMFAISKVREMETFAPSGPVHRKPMIPVEVSDPHLIVRLPPSLTVMPSTPGGTSTAGKEEWVTLALPKTAVSRQCFFWENYHVQASDGCVSWQCTCNEHATG